MEKKLYRNKKDEKIAGVCAGIADYLNVDVTIIRLIWTLFVLCAGSGVLAYIACALVIPEKPDDIVEVE
ncbi:MAG: PspC domain-containing protein [Oscillospiraceae bacterium]|nr:PspC domain-containing protein [Oscillospiraceae bacterium]